MTAKSQKIRILDHLRRGNALTTLEARQDMGILHPAARIQSLRDQGIQIQTVWITQVSDLGITHRVARYIMK
jgi:hypothetical protein